MIFLTIGSHEPFDRLVRAVDQWCAAKPDIEVFGQIALHGDRSYRPQHFDWVEKLAPQAYRRKFEEAQFIIAHAGMGSIITALTMSKTIVVLPRRGHLKETRNDHQFATVQHLTGKPGVRVAMTEADLPARLDDAVENAAPSDSAETGQFADAALISCLRDFVFKA